MKASSRISYALGDTGINLYFFSTTTFLAFFYTDIYGISASTVFWVFLIARFVDAVTDPLIGYLADHTRTRWGRFRPYLLFGAIPLALISIATFTVPDFGPSGKIIWALTTYILFGLLYTVVTIPYASMTSLLTEDYGERATISTLRIGCAFAGALLMSAAFLPFVDMFGGDGPAYTIGMSMAGIIGTLLIWTTFFGTTEREVLAKPENKISIKQAMSTLVHNPPLWISVALFILGIVAVTFRLMATPYYFKYNVGRPDLIAPFLTLTLASMFIPLFFIPKLVSIFSKVSVIQMGSVVAIAGCLGFYFNDPSNIVMTFLWGALVALGGAPIAVLGWALIPDTVEYAQHRLGIRADGVILSTASFFQKLGKTVAGASIPAILAWFGYVANQEQNELTLLGILFCIALVPLIINVLLYIFSALHKLDARTHKDLVEDLTNRLNSEATSSSGAAQGS